MTNGDSATLKLKTNRNDILGWWLIFLVPSGICIIIMLVCTYCLNDEDLKSDTSFIITCCVAWLLGLFVLLFFKYYDRRLHVFSQDNIQVFEKKQLVDYIAVKDIVEIKYIKCNIEYLWKRLSGDSMSDGYACNMYVKMKQGNCYIIGSFSRLDVRKIKKLYGDLVQMI